jgi:SAM-dependent methyltransferase
VIDRADPPEPSGERFVPEFMDNRLVAAEHHVRYRFATTVTPGKRVLDAGCGVGWGSELLLRSGALEVTGVDIDSATVSDAARRCPGARFLVGDLQDLPLDTDSVDVAVCFEALEHVADPGRALDELTRVLTDDGVLLVSSPNPDVYPPGNPFHIHELRPAELLAAVSRRFECTATWHQHALIASTLTSDDEMRDDDGAGRMAILTELPHDRAMYSVVVAAHHPLPRMQRTVALVSARELDDLALTAEALVAERTALAADRDGMRANSAPCHTAPDLSEQLRDAMELRDRHARDAERARSERDDALLRLLELEQEMAAAPRGRPARLSDA